MRNETERGKKTLQRYIQRWKQRDVEETGPRESGGTVRIKTKEKR